MSTEVSPARIADEKDALNEALSEARSHYVESHPQSAAAFESSLEFMPGGNTRTVLFHTPFPLRVVSGDGCRITDTDGIEYVNLLGEYTAGLFGHNHPAIRRAIDGALDRGICLSGHNPDEIRLAQLVCRRFPSIDKVRFTNSGTEANLLAISTARFVTGRSKVLVFEGGYHGGLLYFRGGGMPINAPFDYLLADFNDIDSVKRLFAEHADQVACVLVEPMQGATGCVPGSPAFLEGLERLCRKSGAVLIFDEVMTSRLSVSGAQGLYGITPDMTTLGKYIGGGMTFGAFGGSDELMGIYDPRRENGIPHAGTFNNNALTMAAGAAAMGEVLTDESLDALNARGDRLRAELNGTCEHYDVPIQFTGVGSLLAMHPVRGRITNSRDLLGSDDRILELIFLDLLDRGYYIARRGFIALMLTLDDSDLAGFSDAFSEIVATRLAVLR